jgi:hypothetical protein
VALTSAASPTCSDAAAFFLAFLIFGAASPSIPSTVLALSVRAFCPPVPRFDLRPAINSSSICHAAIARTVSRGAGPITQPSRKERRQPMKSHRAMPCCEIGHSSRGLRVRSAGPTVAHCRISNRISNRLARRLELAVSAFAFNRSQNSNRRKTALFRHRLLAGPVASPDSCPCLLVSAVADGQSLFSAVLPYGRAFSTMLPGKRLLHFMRAFLGHS